MKDSWIKEEWDDSEEEQKPYVKEIILPPHLYKHTLKRGYETYKEVGFYLIGLFKNKVCYIHDLIEFDYSEQSGGFIESGMARYVRLKAGLPLGLRIVGHMHKHPGFTSYSATDRRNFLRYGHANPLNAFLIYTVSPHEEIEGYTATAQEIFQVKVIIRDLTSEEKLMEKEVKIEFTTKVLLPKNAKYSDFRFLFTENIGSETLKFLSRPKIQVKGEPAEESATISEDVEIKVVPRKAIEIEDVSNNDKLRYRIFMEERETIADLGKILKELTKFPDEKGYKVIFYEAGRKLSKDTKLSEINHPLVWNLEKSLLLPTFTNFLRFWDGVIDILKDKDAENLSEPLETSESEAINQQANKSSEKIVPKPKKKEKEFKRTKLDYYT